jgi:hypothetical protein
MKFDMVPYIDKIIDAFPEKITGVTSTPAADHLFAVSPLTDACLLPKDQAQKLLLNSYFYPGFVMISRLLFLSLQQE